MNEEIKKAYAEGKEVQTFNGSDWVRVTNADFIDKIKTPLRVKPEARK